MNKIDLIIDALETAYEDKAGWCDKVNEALYAARELRDAESKKAQWGNPKYLIEEAVLAEREACAKFLDDFSKTQMVPVKDTWRMGVMAAANAVMDKK